MLEDDAKDTMAWISGDIEIPKWLERYNCNGECKSYLEPCNGGCDHPEDFRKGGITLNLTNPVDHVKCGKQCRDRNDMKGFHDCGDECLSESFPCNGICPNSTQAYTTQWKCGNECRPHDEYRDPIWRECPDGSCRDKSVECDGPLPGSCPEDKVLCRYHSWT